MNPAVAVTAGVVLLGEPLTGGILAAFALILGGLLLATAAQTGRSTPAEAVERAEQGSLSGHG